MTFRNAGWGGDTSGGGLARLQRDVLSLKPTVVTICYGMNDAGYREFQQKLFDKFMAGMTGIVTQLKHAGIRVVLLTPGFVDTDRVDRRMKIYNDTLGRFGQGVKDLAEKEKLEFYNVHDLMLDVHARAKAKDPAYSLNETGHPTEPGHATIAYAVLKALGCKDQASGLEIDAANSKATPDRCQVSELSVKDDAVTFKRCDDALPTYLPPKAYSSLEFFPFTKDFNQYNFKVTGLKAGKWTLIVEGAEVERLQRQGTRRRREPRDAARPVAQARPADRRRRQGAGKSLLHAVARCEHAGGPRRGAGGAQGPAQSHDRARAGTGNNPNQPGAQGPHVELAPDMEGNPMTTRSLSALLSAMVLLPAAPAAMAQCPLKDGDRVVFLGETATYQAMYTRFAMDYFTLRYPGLKVSFRNAGVWNEVATDGLARLQRDVLSLKPTVVTVFYGRGDGGFADFQQGLYDRYTNAMTGIVTELKKSGVRVVLLSPPAMDPDRSPPWANFNVYNNTLGRYAQSVKELATKETLEFYDVHALLLDVIKRSKAKDPKYTLMNEGNEPNVQCHAVIAYALLKALGCKDQPSSLAIDIAKAAATPDRCRVDDLKVQADSITFKRFDDALPTYLPPAAHSALPFFPFTQDLNQYNFTVTGLQAGMWKLTVENMEVGTFTDKELAAGVNLATLPGPWIKIGEQVDNAAMEQQRLYFTQWHGVSKLEVPGRAQPEYQALLTKMSQIVDKFEANRIKAVPQERTWQWSLRLAPAP